MLEAARLDALASYDILDTPPEPEFDDVVHIARQACGTATALVGFAGLERQWFKARAGYEGCETPLDQSVCRFSLEVSELLVIPDLAQDARTRDFPVVAAAPHIRFYAGAVLRTPEGVAIMVENGVADAPTPESLAELAGICPVFRVDRA